MVKAKALHGNAYGNLSFWVCIRACVESLTCGAHISCRPLTHSVLGRSHRVVASPKKKTFCVLIYSVVFVWIYFVLFESVVCGVWLLMKSTSPRLFFLRKRSSYLTCFHFFVWKNKTFKWSKSFFVSRLLSRKKVFYN